MGRVTFKPAARTDLDEIFDYIADDDLERAIAFVQKIYEQIGTLAEYPLMGRSREELLPNLRSFPLGNYLIFYFPLKDGVDVVRILRGARNIEALFQSENS